MLLTFLATMMMPATPAAALSLTDEVSQTGQNDGSSGKNMLMNILLGLLMGKFLGTVTNVQSKLPADITKVLGISTGPQDAGSSVKGAQLIETAKTRIGVPYVLGGNSITSGMDESSLTQYVMKQNGISLPRTAAGQFKAGTPVDKVNLQAGDLVFFTTNKSGASHVGIYMGNGEFIHANSALGQVGISSLNEKYYIERYLGARRYIN